MDKNEKVLKQEENNNEDFEFFLKPKPSISQNPNNKNEVNTESILSNNKSNPDNTNKISDDPNSSEKITNDNYFYLKINSRNNFSEMTNDDYELIKEKLDSFYKENLKIQKTNHFLKGLLNSLYPKCETKASSITKSISRQFCEDKNLSGKNIEKFINYFFNFRFELFYSSAIYLNKEAISNLGYIICYIFKKLPDFKIKNSKELKNLIQNNLKREIDVLVDFYSYCNINKKSVDETSKTAFWKRNKENYNIPPELNFLVNRFKKINTIGINIDFEGENLTEEDLKLYTITLLNLDYIFTDLKHFKINFINKKLQYELYVKYYQKLLNILIKHKKNLKKNKIQYPELMYSQKWDFIHDFMLKEYKYTNFKKENRNKKNVYIYDDYNILYFTYKSKKKKPGDELKVFDTSIIKSTSEEKLYNPSENNCINDNNLDDNKTEENFKNRDKKYIAVKRNKSSIFDTVKIRNNYSDIIKNFSCTFDLIVIILCALGCLDKVTNLDIIMNDSYTNEFISYLKNKFHTDEEIIGDVDEDFHVFDFFYGKLKKLLSLNIEINCLDDITFNKAMDFIYKNKSLNSLKFSLFSSDVTYFEQSLFKIYNLIKKDSQNIISSCEINDPDEKIINDLLSTFILNLSVLFEILKNQNNLEELGINIDMPDILINNSKYLLSVIKFIFNLFFLIDNPCCKIKKFILLSPRIILDNKVYIEINDICSNIKLNENNYLTDLSIQLGFNQMAHINNFLSEKLIVLNIGDLDIFTFKVLVKHITSYNFYQKSSLTKLSISLFKTIIKLNTELKLLLRKLFNIKLKSLVELNLYTEIVIDNKSKYFYLIDALKNNWISFYTITFNSSSNKLVDTFKNKTENITFLIPHKYEKMFLTNYESIKLKANAFDYDDEIFWYLKYLFNHKYIDYSYNYENNKKIITTILKYLYFEKKVKLNHSFEKPNDENN